MNEHKNPMSNLSFPKLLAKATPQNNGLSSLDVFSFCRRWLNQLELCSPAQAHLICQLIPAQCPFERTIQMGHFQMKVPPLCKLNPLYEEVVHLRFRALSYLADECSVDVCHYC